MNMPLLIALLVCVLLLWLSFRRRKTRRLAFINNYRFHPAIRQRVQQRYPHLNDGQLEMVMEGLRDYFHLCNQADRKMVSMPSQVVDEAWHSFILFTREYRRFCQAALGRFLHHTPVEAMHSPTDAQQGIKRAWRLACHRQKIDPQQPDRLPLIFALDTELAIPDGFKYRLDCRNPASPHYADGYCAGHIGCASDCAGDSDGGLFDGDGGGSDCGGGCGGD
ncbi:glycine-rich domain-containing protein [Marinobacterium arenosum]|uniref:glycine-rich domain-containing protein n=1 Tax=Marinobacterium arenosum TaxID=2862496 RepID=UPI001C94C5EF|nr:hypothetical protein [Marinobacterium arenosum]MBY4675810.1 hypothetical protein [Marinobacterium arenosum]